VTTGATVVVGPVVLGVVVAVVWACAGRAGSPTAPARAAASARAMASLRTKRLQRGTVDPEQFFAASRVVIVAGKGGVGKTTVTAALAGAAAGHGMRVLVVEVEGKSGLAAMLGATKLGYAEQLVRTRLGPGRSGEIRARTITPDQALLDYLDDHGLRRLSNRLVRTGILDVVATAAPGIDDILVLGKVKQLERSGRADLIVVDAPAAGHAITFLRSARSLLDAVSVGPINTQARDVLELLTDPARCQVVLVTLPEETPVNEVVSTAFALEERVGVSLGPIVVNGLYATRPGLDVDPGPDVAPDDARALRAAAQWRTRRLELQHEQIARLEALLPLPQIHLPFVFAAGLGPDDVSRLGELLQEQVARLVA
jgi:anion-transporting  ArsA/GET3 family ATPase